MLRNAVLPVLLRTPARFSAAMAASWTGLLEAIRLRLAELLERLSLPPDASEPRFTQLEAGSRFLVSYHLESTRMPYSVVGFRDSAAAVEFNVCTDTLVVHVVPAHLGSKSDLPRTTQASLIEDHFAKKST